MPGSPDERFPACAGLFPAGDSRRRARRWGFPPAAARND